MTGAPERSGALERPGALERAAQSLEAAGPDGEWRGLSVRVIWVDFVRSLVSLMPAVLAIGVFEVEASLESLWPFALLAAWGVIGAVADIIRWIFTRYRVTENEIERRTGFLVRRHRSVRHDRIRSVDTHAKLRHRIAGLRVVTVGAGQQTNTGEAAFVLDALTRADAELLRELLLQERRDAWEPTGGPRDGDRIFQSESESESESASESEGASSGVPAGAQERQREDIEVLAGLRPWWVVYHLFSIWAYLLAAGLLWGAYWLAATFGVDLLDLSSRFVDWNELGWGGVVVLGLLVGGVVGALGMGVNFFTAYWRFELARVPSAKTTFLRTRRGLFSTREVNRDEARIRGVSIGEPLLWRWMKMADTTVITTGLGLWDMEEPTAILPRGPRGIARDVAARVLGEPRPFTMPVERHPRAALRRRLWWATALAAGVLSCVALPVASGTAPMWLLWAALGVWPLGLAGAVIAYRALGHAIVGDYLMVRAGLMSRTTSVLRRDAVSTIAVRQSILQKRLGLSTVSAMTAAGWSVYEAPDVASSEALRLAAQAAPGLIDEFLETSSPEI
ncbi:PH domain-containing protein [Nesterenkonia sp. E16_10]|uniref:PH domain-containing protein n=1 Tax=unclassified Nesterenkonia TaxID=2629769 RepID=UPI0031F6643A